MPDWATSASGACGWPRRDARHGRRRAAGHARRAAGRGTADRSHRRAGGAAAEIETLPPPRPEAGLDLRAAAARRLGGVRGRPRAAVHDGARLVQHDTRGGGASDPEARREQRRAGRREVRAGRRRARGGPGAQRLAGGRPDRPHHPDRAAGHQRAGRGRRLLARERPRVGRARPVRARGPGGVHHRPARALPGDPGARLRRADDRQDRRPARARRAGSDGVRMRERPCESPRGPAT